MPHFLCLRLPLCLSVCLSFSFSLCLLSVCLSVFLSICLVLLVSRCACPLSFFFSPPPLFLSISVSLFLSFSLPPPFHLQIFSVFFFNKPFRSILSRHQFLSLIGLRKNFQGTNRHQAESEFCPIVWDENFPENSESCGFN